MRCLASDRGSHVFMTIYDSLKTKWGSQVELYLSQIHKSRFARKDISSQCLCPQHTHPFNAGILPLVYFFIKDITLTVTAWNILHVICENEFYWIFPVCLINYFKSMFCLTRDRSNFVSKINKIRVLLVTWCWHVCVHRMTRRMEQNSALTLLCFTQ